MIRIIVLILFSCLSVTSYCQIDTTGEGRLHVILQPSASSIQLRWAPSNAGLWLKLHRARIVVERQSWEIGKFDNQEPLLISDTLSVWSEEELDSWTDNELVMLVGYCIHAPYESLSEEGQKMSVMALQEQEISNRFSSALYAAERDVDAARAQALYFEDSEVDLKQRSVYTIKMYVDGELYTARTFYNPEDIYTKRPEITRWSEVEGAVVISWDKASHESFFSAYYIERSEDGINYERLTKKPYVHAFDMNLDEENGDFVYIDSVENYVPYYYRIIGLDAFAQESEPSEPKKLMGRDRTPPAAANSTSAIMHEDQYMKVRWKADDPDVDKIFIKKSYQYDGTYTTISNPLQPTDTIFFDLAVDYLGSNFYKVCVYDTARNEACTYPINGNLNDTIPPDPPTGMHGSIDTNGIVTFSWNKNKEIDLKGYKIFFANRYDGVFSVLTNVFIKDTFYIDTISLNTLTEDIFYRVVAADVRENVSNFSPFTRLKKPDIIPPGPSVFKDYLAKKDNIHLEWAPSATKDVSHQLLYRKTDENDWKLLDSLSRKEKEYTDRELLPQVRYHYRIIAVDDAGLQSNSVNDLTIMSPIVKQRDDVQLTSSVADNVATLTVRYTGSIGALDKVIIYQKKSGIKSTYKVLQESQLPYSFPGDINEYTIRAFYSNGQKTGFITSIND